MNRDKASKWKTEMDRRVEVARQAANGGRLPKETLDLVRLGFWQWVDEQLDAAEAAAVARMRE